MPAGRLSAPDDPALDYARELIGVSWRYREARLLYVAHRVGIFERLAGGPAPTVQVAGDLGLQEGLTEKVLIACAALELVVRSNGGWALAPKASAALIPEAEQYVGNWLNHAGEVSDTWDNLENRLRGLEDSGKGGEERRERSHRDFILAMHNTAMAGRADDVADAVDLSGNSTS